ncbi:MAG: hypothetical protein DRR19_15905 [Candidatus Parabeggiatoa sp. nov. 1]|nr:MAG: hypothetical protein DRR19_15905 [Gammaproteobacteria bacterium]
MYETGRELSGVQGEPCTKLGVSYQEYKANLVRKNFVLLKEYKANLVRKNFVLIEMCQDNLISLNNSKAHIRHAQSGTLDFE